VKFTTCAIHCTCPAVVFHNAADRSVGAD
jgi:hypothetical protein